MERPHNLEKTLGAALCVAVVGAGLLWLARVQRRAQGWPCCQWPCSRVSCNRGGWCSPLPWNCTVAPTG